MFHKNFTIRKLLFLFIITAIALTSIWLAPTQATAEDVVHVHTQSGKQSFYVELATTRATQEKGLMFRTQLAENKGMLFIFASEEPLSMWMKNTLIPLDMIFINTQGKIVHIHENATPESIAIISSQAPAIAVLEIAGGVSAKKHINVGDRVEHAALHSTP